MSETNKPETTKPENNKKETPSFTSTFTYKGVELKPQQPQKITEGKEDWTFPGLDEKFTVETLKGFTGDYLNDFLRSILNSRIMQKYQQSQGDMALFEKGLDNLFSESSTRADANPVNGLIAKYQALQRKKNKLEKARTATIVLVEGEPEVNVNETLRMVITEQAKLLQKLQEITLTQE